MAFERVDLQTKRAMRVIVVLEWECRDWRYESLASGRRSSEMWVRKTRGGKKFSYICGEGALCQIEKKNHGDICQRRLQEG